MCGKKWIALSSGGGGQGAIKPLDRFKAPLPRGYVNSCPVIPSTKSRESNPQTSIQRLGDDMNTNRLSMASSCLSSTATLTLEN